MTWHLYFIPIMGTGAKSDPRRPKYLTSLGVPWGMMDYGFQPVALVAADVDGATDISLSANADAHRLPDDLDQPIGATALAIIQNALETRNLPAEWIISTLSYRQVLRTVLGFFAFFQRFATVANTTALLLGGAVTLNTQLNQLSAAARQNLRDTATSLGLDISGVAATSTVRAVLKNVADQWGQRSVTIGGIAI